MRKPVELSRDADILGDAEIIESYLKDEKTLIEAEEYLKTLY